MLKFLLQYARDDHDAECLLGLELHAGYLFRYAQSAVRCYVDLNFLMLQSDCSFAQSLYPFGTGSQKVKMYIAVYAKQRPPTWLPAYLLLIERSIHFDRNFRVLLGLDYRVDQGAGL